MKEIVIALFIASIVVVPVGFVLWRNKRRRERWSMAAERLGLDYNQQLSMSGQFDGFQIFVAIKFHGTSAQKATFTRWTAKLAQPLPTDVDIRPEGRLMRIAQAVGLDDEKLGDSILDDKLIVRASSPASLRRWFAKDGVAEALAELADHSGRYQLTRDTLWLEQRGQVLDVEQIVRTTEKLTSIARGLGGAR